MEGLEGEGCLSDFESKPSVQELQWNHMVINMAKMAEDGPLLQN